MTDHAATTVTMDAIPRPAELPKGPVPHLLISPAARAIDFYVKLFGATEMMRLPHEDGQRLMHACLMINGGPVFLCDWFEEYNGPVQLGQGYTLHLAYPDGVDALWEQALAEGCTAEMPLADQFWGDRYGQFRDPFGVSWSIAQPIPA